ncbi:MAG: hypothetical protein ACYDHN_03715 [Solirubrobacteraceae bacterium]
MVQLAQIAIARPKAALLGWALLTAALSVIGLGVAHSLSPSVVLVPGTESSRAQQLANDRFGPTQLVPIMLVGPQAQLDRQGPKLVQRLPRELAAMARWSTSVGGGAAVA